MNILPQSTAAGANQYLSLELRSRLDIGGSSATWTTVTLAIRFDWHDFNAFRVGLGPTIITGELFGCECKNLSSFAHVEHVRITDTHSDSAKGSRSSGPSLKIGAGEHAATVSQGSGRTRERTHSHKVERDASRVVFQEVVSGIRPRFRFRPFDGERWLLEGGGDLVLQLRRRDDYDQSQGSYKCDVADQLTVANRDGRRFGIFREALIKTIIRPYAPEPSVVVAPFEFSNT